MVQVKKRIRRTIRRIPHLTQHASDPKVPARVNIPRHKIRRALELARKARVVRLCEQARHERGISEPVHDPGDEVATQTVFFRDIYEEGGCGEGTVGYASAARAACDVEAVLGRGRRALGTVAPEAEVWVEDGGGEDGGGVWIFRRGVEGPVPVGLGARVVAF